MGTAKLFAIGVIIVILVGIFYISSRNDTTNLIMQEYHLDEGVAKRISLVCESYVTFIPTIEELYDWRMCVESEVDKL